MYANNLCDVLCMRKMRISEDPADDEGMTKASVDGNVFQCNEEQEQECMTHPRPQVWAEGGIERRRQGGRCQMRTSGS